MANGIGIVSINNVKSNFTAPFGKEMSCPPCAQLQTSSPSYSIAAAIAASENSDF